MNPSKTVFAFLLTLSVLSCHDEEPHIPIDVRVTRLEQRVDSSLGEPGGSAVIRHKDERANPNSRINTSSGNGYGISSSLQGNRCQARTKNKRSAGANQKVGVTAGSKEGEYWAG